jgi:hypothetical protein
LNLEALGELEKIEYPLVAMNRLGRRSRPDRYDLRQMNLKSRGMRKNFFPAADSTSGCITSSRQVSGARSAARSARLASRDHRGRYGLPMYGRSSAAQSEATRRQASTIAAPSSANGDDVVGTGGCECPMLIGFSCYARTGCARSSNHTSC